MCRLTNVFVIGKGDKPLISLPKGKGVRLTILQEQAKQFEKAYPVDTAVTARDQDQGESAAGVYGNPI